MRTNKTFRNLDQQIDILKSKGLIINDVKYAKNVLFRENYYFLNGYRHLFLKSGTDKNFIEKTTFEELYSMFNFDRAVRNILFKYLLIIENNTKSIISYELSKKYGFREKDYLQSTNFNQDPIHRRQVDDLIYKMKRQIRVNGMKHAATGHYMANYGYVPMWVLVKVLSFGLVSELFSILKPEDQLEVSNYYDLDTLTMKSYFHILANFRNLCAHEDIVYNHRTEKTISDSHFHYKLGIPMTNGEYIYGKNDLFALIIIFKCMLTAEEFTKMMTALDYEIKEIAEKVTSININKILNAMGIPKNYIELINL